MIEKSTNKYFCLNNKFFVLYKVCKIKVQLKKKSTNIMLYLFFRILVSQLLVKQDLPFTVIELPALF